MAERMAQFAAFKGAVECWENMGSVSDATGDASSSRNFPQCRAKEVTQTRV